MVAWCLRFPLGDCGAVAADCVEGSGADCVLGMRSFLVPLRKAESFFSFQQNPSLRFLNSKWLTDIRKRELCIEKFIPLRICDVSK